MNAARDLIGGRINNVLRRTQAAASSSLHCPSLSAITGTRALTTLTPKAALHGTEPDDSSSSSQQSAASPFPATLKDGEYPVLPAPPIPPHIPRPYFALTHDGKPQTPFPPFDPNGEVKTARQIDGMKKAARLAARALRVALEESRMGVTTDEVDRRVHEFLVQNGAYPSGVGFHGFPRACCVSPNEVAAHGIPNLRPLQEGDIVNYDITCYLEGFYGDTSAMALVGNVSGRHRELSDTTKECLERAISMLKPGVPLRAIGEAIKSHAEAKGFSVNADFHGHFIGEEMHLPPVVSPLPPSRGGDIPLRKGQIFTIEPILTEGSPYLRTWSDGWTCVTRDNGFTAQWEHTVLITADGAEILTVVD
ncbi:unnamed protein product [Vitrella brassicaformis CCMP3155]|uniref:Methionine aminopeptidase n=1 Tax=Vitrella brassicaformis (strain CCMP3155) TaxID=1169540 RepID=A0A0G4GDQ4_VITBC|nr:unnamed protein product [Vitrella brassicaformis CCMP3155]|eukprot:CEM27553.1 unnamed protein product [Vitrella brassicaformis CCMP3155]